MNNKLSRNINYGIITLALASMVMGAAGWHVHFQQLQREVDLWTSLFLGLQLFTLNADFDTIQLPLALNIARFTAPLSFAGAIISGLLLLTRNGYSYLRIRFRFRRHVIICGLTRRSRVLIKDLKENLRKTGVVVIDDKPERAESLQGKNVVFLSGNPASAPMLKKAGIKKAAYILLLDDDIKDLNCLSQIREMDFKGKVVLHLNDPKTARLYKAMSKKLGLENLHVISDAKILTNRIIDTYSPDQFVQLKSPADPPAYILLAGDDPMILQLLHEAAIMYHFANLKRLRITLLVADTDAFQDELDKEMPNLNKVVDYSIIGLKELWQSGNPIGYNTIGLCMLCCKTLPYAVEIGRRLRQIFFEHMQSVTKPIIVLIESLVENQQPLDDKIIKTLNDIHLSYCYSLQHFSTQTVIRDIEKYDTIAKFIHNGFRIREDKDYTNAEMMWSRLSDAEKDWNRWPARHFHIKLRVVDAKITTMNDPAETFDVSKISDETKELLAQMEKLRWNAEKWLTGFVPGQYLEDKNLETYLKKELKYHPALIPWSEISEQEKQKDTYAFNDIEQILARANLKIVSE